MTPPLPTLEANHPPSRIRVDIDKVRYVIEFTGIIDISRMNGSDSVAIRVASEDAKILSVSVDAEEMESRKKAYTDVLERMEKMAYADRTFCGWFHQQISNVGNRGNIGA